MDMSLATFKLRTDVCGIEVTITDAINAILLLTIIPLLDLVLVPMLRNFYVTILKRLGVGATIAFLSILVLFLFEAVGPHTNSGSDGGGGGGGGSGGGSGGQVCMFDASSREQGQLHISVYWILLPLVLVTLAEIFIYIPSECEEHGTVCVCVCVFLIFNLKKIPQKPTVFNLQCTRKYAKGFALQVLSFFIGT